MREILFRGKKVSDDNSETKWIIGDLLTISSPVITIKPLKSYNCYEVIPETIGQYTGLTDRNGVKIFEGDIVSAYSDQFPKSVIGMIKYGRFTDIDSVDNYDYLGWYIEINDNCLSILQPETDSIYIDVIGNIHDNPELLNGGEAENDD